MTLTMMLDLAADGLFPPFPAQVGETAKDQGIE